MNEANRASMFAMSSRLKIPLRGMVGIPVESYHMNQ
jgi:hypothetical protein